MNLKIVIPQEKKTHELPYNQELTPNIISTIICQETLLPKLIIPTLTKIVNEFNQELDPQKTLQEQGINPQMQLYFYYSQSIKIKCLCDKSNFNLEVDSLKRIADYFYIFKQKTAKPYLKFDIVVICQGKSYKQDTQWFQTGINNTSQVEIKILLPVQFIYCKEQFQEQLPSTWKVHKIITHISEKKKINEIIQFTQNNKIIEYDLDLSELYCTLNDWQIEVVTMPCYLIKLKDGKQKQVKIYSKKKVIDLCELIKKEFNINKNINLELYYGLMKLNNQALIIDEMILNNSTLEVNNLNLIFNQFDENVNNQFKDNYEERLNYQNEPKQKHLDYKQNQEFNDKQDDKLKITLINKKNKQQIFNGKVNSSDEINRLDYQLIPIEMRDKLFVQYFQENNKPIIANTIFGNLDKDEENNIKIEFFIEKKKKSILKNISSVNQIYEFKFLYNQQLLREKVCITQSLSEIEDQIKQRYKIPEQYSIFSEDSHDATIFNLGLQQFNVIFSFEPRNLDNRSFQTIIYPYQETLISETSQVKNIFQLKEKIKKKYSKENDQTRIQIKLNQKNLQDDQQLSELIKQNNTQKFEATILDQFEVIFLGPNQYKLIDQVYEDYQIKESVICLGLQDNDFTNRSNPIKIENNFQFYQINKQNQVIEYQYQQKINYQKMPENNRTQGNNTQEHQRDYQNNTVRNNIQVEQEDRGFHQ